MKLKPLFYFTIIISIVASCAKTDSNPPDNIVPGVKKKALFKIESFCKTAEWVGIDTAVEYKDSMMMFTNLSETGNNIKYLWNFGDGDTSTQIHPLHRYRNTGTYTATLVTFYNNQPSDTFSAKAYVMLHEAEFKSSEYDATLGVDVVETNEGDLISLGFQDSYGKPALYCIVKCDSVFNKIWWKTFPKAQHRFRSIEKNSDGTFILSGNLQPGNPNVFSISKMDKDGNVIWAKFYSDINGHNVFTKQTADGGYITVGSSSRIGSDGNTYFFTMTVKTDALGNELWRYSMDQGGNRIQPTGTSDLAELNNKYYLPAVIRVANGRDSLLVVTLDNSGYETANIKIDTFTTSQAFEELASKIYTLNGRIILYGGGSFIISDTNFQNYNRYNLIHYGIRDIVGANGIIYILGRSQQNPYMFAYNLSGQQIWERYLPGRYKPTCYSNTTVGLFRNSDVIRFTIGSHLLQLSTGINNDLGIVGRQSFYLRKVRTNGALY